jgi:MPBQ/MSBQ methyltransferase
MNAISNKVVNLYDDLMYRPWISRYYGESDWCNFGYWNKDTGNVQAACENLMEQLLALIPDKKGSILDVACGKGETTRYLLRWYPASDIIGINISSKQLETARRNAPDCRFDLMDATNLEFADEFFDNIISVEAAFHFDTRQQFVEEAYRVLKPGGSLVISDIIHRPRNVKDQVVPAGNEVRNLSEYSAVYRNAGFQEIKIIDATRECWLGYRANVIRWGWQKLLEGQVGVRDSITAILALCAMSFFMKRYLLVSARKNAR